MARTRGLRRANSGCCGTAAARPPSWRSAAASATTPSAAIPCSTATRSTRCAAARSRRHAGPLAQPAAGRPLPLRRRRPPARPVRAGKTQRDPRPGPLAALALVEQTETSVTVEVTLLPQTGYPYGLRVRNDYTAGRRPASPWPRRRPTSAPNRCRTAWASTRTSRVGTPTVDEDRAERPGRHLDRGRRRAASRPAAHPVEGSPYDYRTARLIGDAVLDTAFTDLIRDDDGRQRRLATLSDGTPDDPGLGGRDVPLPPGLHRRHAGRARAAARARRSSR